MTPKQLRFVDEYLVDHNATKAAIRAGYSKRTARSIGHRLLTYVDISGVIAQAVKEQQRRTLITADRVLLDIQAIGDRAFAAKDYAQALRSRELLGRRYKLFTDRVEVADVSPRAERLRAARERRKKA